MNRRAALAALALSGCAVPDHVACAENEVPKFHGLCNTGEFEKIWYFATTEFQNRYSKETFVALMTTFAATLGTVTSTQRVGWQGTYVGGRVYVTLSQNTQYQKAMASETFTYRIDGNLGFLSAYFINSPALAGRST